jgi:replicative DNA helicase
MAPGTNSTVTKDAPPPEINVSTEVNQQLADASQAEKEVVAQAQQEAVSVSTSAAVSSSTVPPTINLGQTIDEVTAILGSPDMIVDLGPKKIYKYQNMKVTFKDGKVADVE